MEILELIEHAGLAWAETWIGDVTPDSVLNLMAIGAVLIVARITGRADRKLRPWYYDLALLVVSMLCMGAILGAYIQARVVLNA